MEAPHNTYEAEPLSWDGLQTLTAQTASYESFPDPEAVLRNGFIGELLEVQEERGGSNNEALAGETGDVLWYVSEIARSHGFALSGILDWQGSIDDYQGHVSETAAHLVPVLSPAGQELDPTTDPEDAIAVYAARVIDTMHPKPDDPGSSLIWQGVAERPGLVATLRDTINCLCRVADKYDISLSQAAGQTLEKLASRPRQPHVIEQGPADSQRWRLRPWIVASLEVLARE